MKRALALMPLFAACITNPVQQPEPAEPLDLDGPAEFSGGFYIADGADPAWATTTASIWPDLSDHRVVVGPVSAVGVIDSTRLPSFRIDAEDSLREIAALLQRHAGVNVVVSQEAEEAMSDAGAVVDIDVQRSISLRSALDLVELMVGGDVTWTTRHDVIYWTTPDNVQLDAVLAMYDVHDLVVPVRSVPAPDIGGLAYSGYDPEPEDEPDPVPRFEDDTIVTLIQDTVFPESWDQEGVSINLRAGVLVVRHTREAQLEIRKLLALLR